jgi:two-component system sensor kinase FixL
VNPWIVLAQATVVGLFIYSTHASVRTWRAGQRQKAWLAGGSIGLFTFVGLGQAILHSWGIVPMPLTIAWFFLVVVVAMGYQLSQGILEAEAMVGDLQAQKALTDAVFDGMPGLLGLYGKDGRLLRWNRNLERLTGYPAEELAQTTVQDWYRGMALGRSDNRWSQGLEAGRSVFETRLGTRNGDPLTVLISFARLELRGIVHLLAIGIDITEERRMDQELSLQRRQLAHLDRVSAMGLLSASIAHELNQPLTAILSNAQAGIRFLAAPDPDLAELREILKDIAEEDARAGKVIRGMRTLLKKEAGTTDVVDLGPLLEDTALMLRGESVIRNIPIRLDLGRDLPRVRGDRVQFQQVALNLLVNAMEAMDAVQGRERWIDVKAGRTGAGDLRIQVIDRGTGIPGDQLEQVFQPFRTSKRGGMGIGLSVCRSILESVGGRIRAENNEGPGATFTVLFPASSLELP